MSPNDNLHEWNETLAEGQKHLNEMRRRAIRLKDGWYRRCLMRLIRFMERWIERGKRWRDSDLGEDSQ